MNLSDEELVLRSQKKDRQAFEELVRRTARLVFAQLYLQSGRPADEDLVQETFLSAWRSIGQLDQPRGFRPWLLAIARSVVIDSARKHGRQKRAAVRLAEDAEAAVLGQLPDPQPPPPETLQRQETQQRVLDALRSLPEEYRQPLMLRYLAGADYQSMTRELGLSNGALRGLLHRGMARLREEIRKAGVDLSP